MKVIKNTTYLIAYFIFLKIISSVLTNIFNFVVLNVNAGKVPSSEYIFNVVGFFEEEPCIYIEDIIYECKGTKPIFSCTVPVNEMPPGQANYQYSNCDGSGREKFNRTIYIDPDMDFKTKNEFYKRKQTDSITFLPEIWERPYEASSSEIFNLDYVGTFHLTVDNTELLQQMNEQPHSSIKVPFHGMYIGETFTKNFNENGWQLSITGNYSRMFTKQSFKIAYKGTENRVEFEPRKLKLKGFPNDATMLREPICLELVKKVGIPTYRGSYARLYINEEFYGLYFMEDTMKKTYIKSLFHKKAKNPEIGPLFQAKPFNGVYNASLNYINDNAKSYPNWNRTWDCKINGTTYGSKDESFPKLINLMKLINQTNIATVNDPSDIIHTIYNIFELDIFIRLLAVDYLVGRFHGYWRNPSNFLIYFHPALDRYIIFPVDFTSSLGYRYSENNYTYRTNYTEWRLPENLEDPLINMVMNTPFLKTLFLQTLNLIVENIFNPETLFPFIDSLKYLIKEDLYAERKENPYHSKTSIIEEVEVKEMKEESINKDANGFPSNSTIDTTIIIKKNTTITLIDPHWGIDRSFNNIEYSDPDIGYGIKEWIEKRCDFLREQFVNETIVSAGSLITRPSDPTNLYSDSILDYFETIFPSGKYKLLAFFLAALFIIILIVFIIHVKCKRPIEMEGDEHDIRKYNDSFFQRIKTGFNFRNNQGILQNVGHSIRTTFKSLHTKTRNLIYHKSRNVD